MNRKLKEGYQLLSPQGTAAFEAYFNLRWSVLREPWGQPKGSERDDQEDQSFHLMVQSEKGEVVACGRIQQIDETMAQVRYMGVAESVRGMGFGAIVLEGLEQKACEWGLQNVFLQARENAVPFYKSCGYEIVETTFLLYNSIQHYKMVKKLL